MLLIKKNERIAVTIHLHTRRISQDQMETENYYSTGELMEKGGSLYLRYEEKMDELGKVTTVIKFSKKTATIIRHGAITMRQELVLQKETQGSYQTPYGRLTMWAMASRIEFGWIEKERTGKLRLFYTIGLDGEAPGKQELTFNLEEVKE